METEQKSLHDFLWDRCGLPRDRCPLEPRIVGTVDIGDIRIDKLVYDTESFSSVTAHLYVPKEIQQKAPALVMASGHGGSKSAFYNQYAGQLYARAGLVVLIPDALGEEERHPQGEMGTRAHDRISEEVQRLGRPVLGKIVWDLMRGIDYLQQRTDIVDSDRIGVGGHSLGAILSAYLAALDHRIKLALLASMYFHPTEGGSHCMLGLLDLISERIDYPRLLGMAAPRCATLILVGDNDDVCGGSEVFDNGHQETFRAAQAHYTRAGEPGRLTRHVYRPAGHRPYFLDREAVLWVEKHLGLPNWNANTVLSLPRIRQDGWARANGVTFETRYGTEMHNAGAQVLDVGARYIQPSDLACLGPDEQGNPRCTIDGWFAGISGR